VVTGLLSKSMAAALLSRVLSAAAVLNRSRGRRSAVLLGRPGAAPRRSSCSTRMVWSSWSAAQLVLLVLLSSRAAMMAVLIS
jgi:hypothetical protein